MKTDNDKKAPPSTSLGFVVATVMLGTPSLGCAVTQAKSESVPLQGNEHTAVSSGSSSSTTGTTIAETDAGMTSTTASTPDAGGWADSADHPDIYPSGMRG